MQPLTSKYESLIDNTPILSHYSSIIELKKSQAKINLLISLPQTQAQEREELTNMKESIEDALKEQLTTLRAKEKESNAYPLSTDLLVVSDLNKLAKCFLVEERKWGNSRVEQIDVQEQTASVIRYGNNTRLTLPAYYLKVLKEPDPALFEVGTHCKCIFGGDGEFYPCVIEAVLQDSTYRVRYKKYNSEEIVCLHRLRPSGAANPQNQKEMPQVKPGTGEFIVPQKYKILPNDSEAVKKSKKTKVKALKFQHRTAQIEQINREKQDKWKSWNSSSNSLKLGHFKTKHDYQVMKDKPEK